jgi:hypothetical protein
MNFSSNNPNQRAQYYNSYNPFQQQQQQQQQPQQQYKYPFTERTPASLMARYRPKYLVVHCKHSGCYDFNFIEHRETKSRFIPVTINTPKIFMFENKEEAREFFNEYMTDVDVVDPKCRVNGEIHHAECCACGVIDLDEEEQPNLFYNKTNQIFLLEHTADTFMANQNVRSDINNLNITTNFMKRCKSMPEEQRRRYIELGKMCEECNLEGYLEKNEREEEEKRREAERKLREEEIRLEAEEKRRQEGTEQLAEAIFLEIEKKLYGDQKALSLLGDIKKQTTSQLQQQFSDQMEALKKTLHEPKHKPNRNNVDEPRNVIVTEPERRPLGPLAKAKGASLFAPPPKQTAAPTPAPAPANENIVMQEEAPKKRKYTKKPKPAAV